jgi:hypothetical protein
MNESNKENTIMKFEDNKNSINQLLQERIAKQSEIRAKKAELRAIEGKIFQVLVESSTGPGYVDWVNLMADPQSCQAERFGS